MKAGMDLAAVLFDCDGTLVETERDGHRVAFNEAFRALGINAAWDAELYGRLLKVGGGKERMRRYFDEAGWPAGQASDELVGSIHHLKTGFFMRLAREGRLPMRAGIPRLVDEAIAAGVPIAVCSTSNEKSVRAVIEASLGKARMAAFAAILAGDVVANKKPAPDIYDLAARMLGLEPCRTVVIEDSRIGLLAAKAAGMRCVITPSIYSRGEEFPEADLVVDDLDAGGVGLDELVRLVNPRS